MTEQRLCTVTMLAKALRHYGITAAWIRSEAEAGRIPCLWSGDVMLFDLEAVRTTLLARAARGEVSATEATPSAPEESRQRQPASYPHMMSTEQAAEYLGLNAGTLRVWRSRGRYPDLRFVKVGRMIRYRRDDLDKWIRKHTAGDSGIESEGRR